LNRFALPCAQTEADTICCGQWHVGDKTDRIGKPRTNLFIITIDVPRGRSKHVNSGGATLVMRATSRPNSP
jgi:hypothetical protein